MYDTAYEYVSYRSIIVLCANLHATLYSVFILECIHLTTSSDPWEMLLCMREKAI